MIQQTVLKNHLKSLLVQFYVFTIRQEFFETFLMPRHNVGLIGLNTTAEMYFFFGYFITFLFIVILDINITWKRIQN